MTAVYSAGSGASAGGYSQAIDVSSLTAGAVNKIGLPVGAVDNNYALSLNLTNCDAADKFSWTVAKDPTGRVTITPGGAANHSAQFSLANLSDSDVGQQLQVTVQLTRNSAAPPVIYTLLLDTTVIRCDPINIEPTVLMPVVVGAAYTQKLAAYGARDNFIWSVDTSSSPPPGLKWDASSHELSGTVADATQAGKSFNLVLVLTASDVIMDPMTVSLGIIVQPAQALASDMPSWEKILLYFSVPCLVIMGIIVAAVVDRIKQGKANAKTGEAIRAGNTIH